MIENTENKINLRLRKANYHSLLSYKALNTNELKQVVHYFDTCDFQLYKNSLALGIMERYNNVTIMLKVNIVNLYNKAHNKDTMECSIPFQKDAIEKAINCPNIVFSSCSRELTNTLDEYKIELGQLNYCGKCETKIHLLSLENEFPPGELEENKYFGYKDWELKWGYKDSNQLQNIQKFLRKVDVYINSETTEDKYSRFVRRYLKLLLDNRE